MCARKCYLFIYGYLNARDALVARLRLLRLLYTGGRCPRTKLAIMRAECACNHLTKNSEVVLVEDLVYPRGNRGYWLLRVPSILLGRSILLHVQLFYLQKAYVSMAHSRAGCFSLAYYD